MVSELLKELFPHTGRAFVIGVTGSSGTGKSTLVDQLARHDKSLGRKVGIIAVDPTSPFSGGAILGDRIRMQSLFTDPNVFIRSMATRGQMGGLSRAVNEALLVLDAAGYETLMVETVGVGQDEVDIAKTAHLTLVILVPGMGDAIQTIKAGIMEIGDIFVINKADRPEVFRTEQELEALLSIASREDGWNPLIVKTVATRGEGIKELADAIERYRAFLSDPRRAKRRGVSFFRERLVEMLRDRLIQKVLKQIPEGELDRYAEKIMTRELDPYTIMDRLLRDLGLEEETHD
ncbi:methylmalonyl Co-A mutase-associated GTPase MeaB [Acidobacteria bacterium AH-259-O06]|nr:methylmalonyl Co-A mutase-associated GTPase MeaB [Acidobacteria bacterium AH-259-O06]